MKCAFVGEKNFNIIKMHDAAVKISIGYLRTLSNLQRLFTDKRGKVVANVSYVGRHAVYAIYEDAFSHYTNARRTLG
jgi:hypothetical protein